MRSSTLVGVCSDKYSPAETQAPAAYSLVAGGNLLDEEILTR